MSVPWQGEDGHLNPGEPAAECPEEPAVPAAGAHQHPEGAARGAAPPAAALHRYPFLGGAAVCLQLVANWLIKDKVFSFVL